MEMLEEENAMIWLKNSELDIEEHNPLSLEFGFLT